MRTSISSFLQSTTKGLYDWLIGDHNSALILYQVEMETTSNRLRLCQFNKGMEIVSL